MRFLSTNSCLIHFTFRPRMLASENHLGLLGWSRYVPHLTKPPCNAAPPSFILAKLNKQSRHGTNAAVLHPGRPHCRALQIAETAVSLDHMEGMHAGSCCYAAAPQAGAYTHTIAACNLEPHILCIHCLSVWVACVCHVHTHIYICVHTNTYKEFCI